MRCPTAISLCFIPACRVCWRVQGVERGGGLASAAVASGLGASRAHGCWGRTVDQPCCHPASQPRGAQRCSRATANGLSCAHTQAGRSSCSSRRLGRHAALPSPAGGRPPRGGYEARRPGALPRSRTAPPAGLPLDASTHGQRSSALSRKSRTRRRHSAPPARRPSQPQSAPRAAQAGGHARGRSPAGPTHAMSCSLRSLAPRTTLGTSHAAGGRALQGGPEGGTASAAMVGRGASALLQAPYPAPRHSG